MTTNWFTEKTVSTWEELYCHLETYLNKPSAKWVFRGQSRAGWPLDTKIERLREQFDVKWSKLPSYEKRLVREFRRRAHNYHPSPPEEGDHLEWLALLRHHFGPTRLLDFSFSPLIATYFALEAADKDSAVWAINYKWLCDQAEGVVKNGIKDGSKVFQEFLRKRDGISFKTVFWDKPHLRFVSGANPMRLNERLTMQQGLFLCPGDITTPFEENLKTVPRIKTNVHKIVIKFERRVRADALGQLRRMNIDRTALFPGLDGLAQSLNTRFVEIGEMPIAAEEDTT